MSIDPSVIGRELPSFTVEVERGRVRLFAEVIGDANPVFTDLAAARAAGHPDLPVPPTFLFGFVLEGAKSTQWLDDLGIDLGNVLHAEQTFTYHDTAHAGDVLVYRPRISDTFEKKGGALRFVVREISVTREDGTPVADLRDSIAVVRPTPADAR